MAGDAETGVALMRMEEGLDTGPVAREARTPIRPEDTSGELTSSLAKLGARLLSECWSELRDGRLVFHPQSPDGVTYARKIDKGETPIDWTRDASEVRNHIHGLSPAPGAHSEIVISGVAERIKFLRVDVVESSGSPGTVLFDDMTIACGRGAIRPREAQRPGKTPMSGAEIVRGGKIRVGDRFTPSAELRSDRRAGV
jgi:methionyl-tRNA formyltransferase